MSMRRRRRRLAKARRAVATARQQGKLAPEVVGYEIYGSYLPFEAHTQLGVIERDAKGWEDLSKDWQARLHAEAEAVRKSQPPTKPKPTAKEKYLERQRRGK